MGSYAESLALSPVAPDVTQTRAYRTKYGFGLDIEQALTSDFGVFSRLGWNNGQTETWAFTEIDRTVSLGLCLKGTHWKRPQDTVGAAFIVNEISNVHANYLASGGYGFLIGDGKLSYAPEQIAEAYYLFAILQQLSATADFQFVNHPAYNADRGPNAIFAARVHYEF
jgi:high affinity Mn2+ porin